jgi:hypothetical protein
MNVSEGMDSVSSAPQENISSVIPALGDHKTDESDAESETKSNSSFDRYDKELGYDSHYGWPWNAYKKIVKAYLQGPQTLRTFLNKNRDEFNLDEIILYALQIDDSEDYDFGYDADTDDEDNEHSDAEINDNSMNQRAAHIDNPPKTNVEMAEAVIAALLKYPELQEPKPADPEKEYPCYREYKLRAIDPDNMLRTAVNKDIKRVDALLTIPQLNIHPASALPQVEWHIKHRQNKTKREQDKLILQRLLEDIRVHEPNIHKLAWAASKGDLGMMEEILNNEDIGIAEGDIRPLYWAVKNEKIDAFSRLLDDSRFNNPQQLEALFDKTVFHNDRKIELALILLNKSADKQKTYEEILLNAVRGKALGLMKTLLENPEYAGFIKNFDTKEIGGLFIWGVSGTVHHERRDAVCALLNAHFSIENKPKFIAKHCYQSHNIIEYLTYLIHSDDECCALIEYFDSLDKLVDEYTPTVQYILWGIQDKVESDIKNGHAIRNFDKSITSIFNRVEWRYKIAAFDTANKISSLETIDALLKALKVEELRNAALESFFDEIGENYVDSSNEVSKEVLDKLKNEIIKRYVAIDDNKIHEKYFVRFCTINSANTLEELRDGLDDFGVKSALQHYRHVVIHTAKDKSRIHFDANVQEKKIQLLIKALDLPHDSDFLFDKENRYQNRDLKEILCQLTLDVQLDLIQQTAEAGNFRLFMLLQKIKSFHRGDKIPDNFDCWYQGYGGFNIKREKEPFFEALCFAVEDDHDQHRAVKLITDRLSVEQRNELFQYALNKRGEVIPALNSFRQSVQEFDFSPFLLSLMAMPAAYHEIPCMDKGKGLATAQFLLDNYDDLVLSPENRQRLNELSLSTTLSSSTQPDMLHRYTQQNSLPTDASTGVEVTMPIQKSEKIEDDIRKISYD